ncbi:probable Intermediate cleaving peptidase 55 [Saccharomycodes ludwigii]|uniref:Probable Intermediate cleaving peptidase 55 n=1 Tax=Saccharomycodes ludwigii TaxID=36035 RepID=A0A376B5Y0_9ASCO|nr:probable Intermediate cleaving peptidase 55 [Saccharomycodes ludwigii]
MQMLKRKIWFNVHKAWFQTKAIQKGQQQYTNKVTPNVNLGQALHENRPYWIKPGELTPGITALEYFERRVKLASKLPKKSCLILPSSQVKYATGPVFYPFQQNTDLYYLTGWNEPDSVMILEKPNDNLDDVLFHMLVPPKDAFAEKWEGFRTGVEGIKEFFNADESDDINNLVSYTSKILKRNEHLYFDIPHEKNNSTQFFGTFFGQSQESKFAITINDLLKRDFSSKKIRKAKPLIAEQRRIKSPAELTVMRTAGQISGRSYNQAYAEKFRNERTLHSFLEYKFISGGCDKSAYVPVVASGSNALCIHYTKNNDVMFDDEMVLVDASGALGGYCSDISRSWPVNGEFSGPQRDLYEAVLNVQRKCITLCKANLGYSIQDIHDQSVNYMVEELKNVGIDNSRSQVTSLYNHLIGHNLGLDVHDVPECSIYKPIEPGQVITIEPGIYVPQDDRYPKWFQNIGIRIEDDVAVEKDSYTILTVEAAKEVKDIENIARNGVTTKIPQDVVSPLF